jgi:hypothetical protein
MSKTITMWGPTSINHFKNLHDYYLKKKPIVHAYAEPTFYLRRDSDESKWYYRMLREKELVYKPFKFYIHPEGDFKNGYGDFCSIQKGTFDYNNMNLGEVFPVILYAHHETMLTVGCVVKTSDHPDIHGKEQLALWIYYPSGENIESFDTASGHIYE